jgi:biotin carboxyl carrier protein
MIWKVILSQSNANKRVMKTYKFKINGNGYEVAINSVEGQTASVTVNGTPYTVELEEAPAAPVQAVPVQAAPAAAPKAAPAASGAGKAVTSPLPGVIIAVKVNVGDAVKAGQEVAVLEAMKMENSIEATQDGTVTAINVAKGDSVLEGAPIVTIA